MKEQEVHLPKAAKGPAPGRLGRFRSGRKRDGII